MPSEAPVSAPTPVSTQISTATSTASAPPVTSPSVRSTHGPAPTYDENAEVKFGQDSFEDSIEDFAKPAKTTEPSETSEPEPETTKLLEPKFDAEETDTSTDISTEVLAEVPTKPVLGSRSYNGLDPEVAALLKELHNAQYNKYKESIPKWYEAFKKLPEIEAKAASAQQPSWWYDQPEAFVLSPEFARSQQTLDTAGFEQNHWQSQLEAIENGSGWKELLGYDARNQPVFKEHPARDDGRIDSRAKSHAIGALAQLSGITRQAQQELAYVEQQFKKQSASALKELQDVEDKIFPNMKDLAKLTKEEREEYESIFNLYPPMMRAHPSTRHTAKAYLSFSKLAKHVAKLNKEHKAALAELETYKARKAHSKQIPVAGPSSQEQLESADENTPLDLKKLADQFSD